MPAKSKAQQRFFGMVRAAQKGEMENPSSEVLDAADSISVKDAKKMAKTKHKGLPEVKEEKKGRHPRDQKELDRAQAYIKKNPNFGKKDVKEEPERTTAYKAMQKKLYPRGSTIDAKTGKDNAIMGNVGGFSNTKNRGKKRKVMAEFEPELGVVEELTGDMKTDLEKHRVPRGPGGNPIRIKDKVSSMKSTQPLGQLKVKYGAGKVREYYKKNKSVGEELELDERLGGKGYKPRKDYAGRTVSGDWEDSDRGAGNKSARRSGKKVEKKSPTYQAYVLNKEEVVDESRANAVIAKRILQNKTKCADCGSYAHVTGASNCPAKKDPKGLPEGVMDIVRKYNKKPEKKAEKAQDAGARLRRKVERRVHAKYVSGSEDNVPDNLRDHKTWSEFKKYLAI